MQVSFIIPTRNQGRFIRRCIDRCLEQGITESEVIVVDGLSTDGTQEILRQYGNRIAWVSEVDSGQAEAVNKGVARARGEIVAWINSDDYYPECTTLPAVLESFDAAPETDIVYGRGTFVDATGKALALYVPPRLDSAVDLLVAPTGPLQPATFFRRSLFLDVGGLRTDLHYAMDYDLWLRMFPHARRIQYLPRQLAFATVHAGAKSVAGVWEQIRELRELKRRHGQRVDLTIGERARLAAGLVSLQVYGFAMRLGLRRVS